MKPADLVRRKLDEDRRIREAILADFVVDPTWTRGAIRTMVVVHAVVRRLGVRLSYSRFVPKVNRACSGLGARRVRPTNQALWRGLRRRE